MKIVWSDMLPWRSWHYNESQVGAKKSWKIIQRRARHLVLSEGGGGEVIKHLMIKDDGVSLLADGVHLSAQRE